MILREFRSEDLKEVQRLHETYYPDFNFPEFFKLLCGFIVEDDDKSIILAGGVELIGEALLVTNKDKNRIKIGKSLVIAQGISQHICKRFDIRELHAFVTDDDYAKHLIQHGFERREEQVLRMRIPNGKEKDNTKSTAD